jgi:hypothetical protein
VGCASAASPGLADGRRESGFASRPISRKICLACLAGALCHRRVLAVLAGSKRNRGNFRDAWRTVGIRIERSPRPARNRVGSREAADAGSIPAASTFRSTKRLTGRSIEASHPAGGRRPREVSGGALEVHHLALRPFLRSRLRRSGLLVCATEAREPSIGAVRGRPARAPRRGIAQAHVHTSLLDRSQVLLTASSHMGSTINQSSMESLDVFPKAQLAAPRLRQQELQGHRRHRVGAPVLVAEGVRPLRAP